MRRSARTRPFLLLGAATLVGGLLVGGAVIAPPGAEAASRASGPISSPGPLTRILTTAKLECQVFYNGVQQFYGDASCGTTVASGNRVTGRYNQWTPESQELTGVGSKADPFVLTTVARGDGWRVTEIDRYVVGKGEYETEFRVTNTTATDRATVVAHVADCYLQGDDKGYGIGDAETGGVTCLKNPPSADDPGQVESFIPSTPGSTYGYGKFGEVYDEVDAGRELGNRMLTSGTEQVDNGMGISWAKPIAAGATEVFEWRNYFLTGEDPLAATSGSGTLDDANGNGRPDAGESVAFALEIENAGTVPLLDGSVVSSRGGTFDCEAEIAVGATASCTSTTSTTITQADIDAGSISDSLVFSAKTPRGADYTADATEAVATLTAVPEGATSTVVSGGASSAGEKVSVTSTVRNTGNVTLSRVTATVNGTDVPFDERSIAPGAVVEQTIEHDVTQAEFDAGRVDFRTEASGAAPSGSRVTLTASEGSADFERQGALEAELSTVVEKAPHVGDAIRLALQVTNTGNSSLHDITVTLDGDPASRITCPTQSLAPGASIECDVTGSYTVTQADVDAGTVSFRATVNAVDTAGAAVQTAATARQATVAQAPALATTVTPALDTAGKTPAPGDEVALTVAVRNTGNVTLRDVAAEVEDRDGMRVSCPTGPLAPGASVDCTVPAHTLSQGDIDAGTVEFAVTATATAPDDRRVTASDSASVTVDRQHGIVATATAVLADDSRAPKVGDHVELAVSARNSGNTTLRDLAAEVDGHDLDAECADGALAPGAEATCTVDDHVLTQDEIDAGAVEFALTVTANGPGGSRTQASDTVTVELASAPAIAMSATSVLDANEHEVPLAGDTATVTMTIRNTGNVTVTGIRGAVEDRAGLEADCPSDELAPGASVTCEVSAYTLTQSDVDSGAVRFVVSSAATGSDRERVEARADTTLSIVRAPSITTTATAALDDTDHAAPAAGDTASVRMSITNTGNVTVHGLRGIVDERSGMTITCPAERVAPGASVDCAAAEYALTQGDVDAGKVQFDVTASAVGSDDQTVTAGAKAGTAIERAPGVQVQLTAHLAASEHEAPRAGDRVTVGIRATNSGNVTLTGTRAEVVELADLPVECAADGVAPGASIDCTTPEYVLTQADVDHGTVTVAAVLDATGPAGDSVTARDEVQVGLTAKSALDLSAEPVLHGTDGSTKAVADDHVLRPGDRVSVRYEVLNTGNLAVHDLQQAEGMPAVTCEEPALEPGQRATCESDVHVVTEEEAATGEVVITGQVAGQVARADGATTEEPGAASTGQTATPATFGVTTAAASTKPVWVFSLEVHTKLHAEPQPVPAAEKPAAAPVELAFTGSTILAMGVPAAIVLLLAGAVLLLWRRQRNADDRQV